MICRRIPWMGNLDRAQWQTLVNRIIHLWIPYKARKLFKYISVHMFLKNDSVHTVRYLIIKFSEHQTNIEQFPCATANEDHASHEHIKRANHRPES
jgi:hypothetical protein